jgi:hypothetical protein
VSRFLLANIDMRAILQANQPTRSNLFSATIVRPRSATRTVREATVWSTPSGSRKCRAGE